MDQLNSNICAVTDGGVFYLGKLLTYDSPNDSPYISGRRSVYRVRLEDPVNTLLNDLMSSKCFGIYVPSLNGTKHPVFYKVVSLCKAPYTSSGYTLFCLPGDEQSLPPYIRSKINRHRLASTNENPVYEEYRKLFTKVKYKGHDFDSVIVDEHSILDDYRRSPEMYFMPHIKKVIFNDPATIVFWSDGTKTVVKTRLRKDGKKKDKFSEEYGLAMAISKKYFGTRSKFLKTVNEYRKED